MASTSPLPVVSTLPSRILRSILLQAAINCMLSDLSRPRERERSMVHGDDRMKRAGPTKHFSSPAAGSTATPSDPPPGNGLNTCAHTRRLRPCQAGRRCALTVKYSPATYHIPRRMAPNPCTQHRAEEDVRDKGGSGTDRHEAEQFAATFLGRRRRSSPALGYAAAPARHGDLQRASSSSSRPPCMPAACAVKCVPLHGQFRNCMQFASRQVLRHVHRSMLYCYTCLFFEPCIMNL